MKNFFIGVFYFWFSICLIASASYLLWLLVVPFVVVFNPTLGEDKLSAQYVESLYYGLPVLIMYWLTLFTGLVLAHEQPTKKTK